MPALTAHLPVSPAGGAHEATRNLRGLDSEARDPLELLDHRTERRLVSLAEAAPGAYLAFESRRGAWLFPLIEAATHLGRGLTADVRVEDTHISRRHATITQDARGTHLLDGRSLNGTWVNGERVAGTVLHSGDLIEVGRLALRYLEIT